MTLWTSRHPLRSPRVGVVVAAYDAERWLEAALGSVAAQSFEDWVCVVVDDGSSDGTYSVAKAAAANDERFRAIQRPNGGPSAARNDGVDRLPPVEYIAFLDSDDLWTSDALERLIPALDGRDDAVGVAGLAELIDEHGQPQQLGVHSARLLNRRKVSGLRTSPMAPDEDITLSTLVVGGTIWPPAIALLRRPAFIRAGGFARDLRLQEDWELFVRMSLIGPIASLPQQVAWYRTHGANLTADRIRNLMAQDEVRRRCATSISMTRPQRCLVERGRRLALAGTLHAQLYAMYRHARLRHLRSVGRGFIGAALVLREMVSFRAPLARRDSLATEAGLST